MMMLARFPTWQRKSIGKAIYEAGVLF